MPPRAPRAKPSAISSKAPNNTEENDGSGGAAPASDNASTPAPVEPGIGKSVEAATPSSAVPQKPPTKRLGSLNRPATAGPSRGRASVVAKPKFVGRRSQAARTELEKEAAAQRATEDAENARQKQRAARGRDGRGGRGRGRGGSMRQDVLRQDIASGPFSSGQVNSDMKTSYARRPGGVGGSGVFGGDFSTFRSGGSGGSSGHTSGLKSEAFEDGFSHMHSMKTEDGGYISSDDEAEPDNPLSKQDIDELHIHEHNDANKDDIPAGPSFDLPRRLRRAEVKSRVVGLSAEELSKRSSQHDAEEESVDGISDKKKGKARAHDIETIGTTNKQRQSTARGSSSDVEEVTKIKTEPGIDENDEEHGPAAQSSRSSNTLDDVTIVEEGVVKDMPASPESKRKTRDKISNDSPFKRPKTPPHPTQQEVDEFHRYWNDMSVLSAELGHIAPKATASTTTADGEGDVKMTDDAARQDTVRSDQVYLFQFPSVLPDLLPKIKPDPDAPEVVDKDDGVMEVDPVNVKKEENVTGAGAVNRQPPEPRQRFPHGLVGKLRVHKSGKTYLDWGGTRLVLGMGSEATYLQNILIAKIPEAKPGGEKPEEDGRALCMGQVRGKFVLQPDWEELFS